MDVYVDKKGNPFRFEITCPYCSKEALVSASIFQLGFGMLYMGIAMCVECKHKMQLTLLLDDEGYPSKMVASEW